MKHFYYSLFTINLILLLSGCGGAKGLSGLVPAAGSVTLNGKALDGANITFVPTVLDNRAAGAITDGNGKFTAATLNGNDGIAPGEYKVVISKTVSVLVPNKGGERKEDKLKMQPKLATKSDGKQTSPPPPPRQKEDYVYNETLGKYGKAETSDLTITIPAKGNKNIAFELTLP
jgi:hypothetical protein